MTHSGGLRSSLLLFRGKYGLLNGKDYIYLKEECVMTTITFVVSVAVAISLGTVGAYILMMKVLTSKRGKQAIKDYTKEITDLTYDILKENMKDTKKWQDLVMGAEE